MDEFIKLRDLKDEYFDSCVMEWDFISDPLPEEMYRIYYKANVGELTGFCFYCIEWVACRADQPHWSGDTEIAVVYDGLAYFDGLRHVNIGDSYQDERGYFNYPNAISHSQIWQELRNLEIKYCREIE